MGNITVERLAQEDMPYFLEANSRKRAADAALDIINGVLIGKYQLRDGDQLTPDGQIIRLRAVGPRPLPTNITPNSPLTAVDSECEGDDQPPRCSYIYGSSPEDGHTEHFCQVYAEPGTLYCKYHPGGQARKEVNNG